jgi:hypothetical protein
MLSYIMKKVIFDIYAPRYLGFNEHFNIEHALMRLINPNVTGVHNQIHEHKIQSIYTRKEESKGVMLPISSIDIDFRLVQYKLECNYVTFSNKIADFIKWKYGYDLLECERQSKIFGNVIIYGKVHGLIYINNEKYIVYIVRHEEELKYMSIAEQIQIILQTKLYECNKVIYINHYGNDMSIHIFDNFEYEELYCEIIKRLTIISQCNTHDDIKKLCYWI